MTKQVNQEKEQGDRIDYGIIMTIMLLGLIGMAAIYMAISYTSPSSTAIRAVIMQLVWYAIGGVGVVFVMRFDAEQLWRIAPYLFALGIFLLIAVLIFYNRAVAAKTGAKSWFAFGPITFQPSEVMKPAFILMLSRVVTLHNTAMPHTTKNDWLLIGKMLAWTLPVVALLLLQHDLGTTLVFLAIFAGIILVSGITWKIIAPIGGGAILIGGGALVMASQSGGRELLRQDGVQAYKVARNDSGL